MTEPTLFLLLEGEYKLGWIDQRDTLGFEVNRTLNRELLQHRMDLNLSIKDISHFEETGPYLDYERMLLGESDWSRNDDLWYQQ